AAMAADRLLVTLLVAALLLVEAALGVRDRPLVGAPVTIDDAGNSEGLQRALRFAMAQYNKASNDMYFSRVVRVISAKRQIVAGINYIMEVEIGRTTCQKPATNLQNCPLSDAPQMSERTVCKFTVYSVPWENKMELVENRC
ncbi:CYT protein, partial [Rhinopomastus cyanomelas]|nr:CYT protein [Rhinopomastus cyanomelas]